MLSACHHDPLEQLLDRLDDPTGREEAVDGLVRLVQQTPAARRAEVQHRVVNALVEAYRDDESRGEIVAGLAALRDPRASEVFVAALGDAERGGTYFEAAVRSAKLIGELGLKREVPALVSALRRASASPRADRNTWLERALIAALVQLGDARAVEALVQVLRGDPSRQDFYLNKLAAAALGQLGDPRAVRPLVTALASSDHGLLLFEESRRALCRLGAQAAPELLAAAARRDRRGQPEANAPAAARVLADLGEARTAPQLAGLPRAKDPLGYRLAIAEAQLRLGLPDGEATLLEVLGSAEAPLTSRRAAAELLGWYGSSDAAASLLRPSCKGSGPAVSVLCWSAALAFTRLAGPHGREELDAVAASGDAVTRRYLTSYRPRVQLAADCADDLACYRGKLADEDWRVQERAALELGRRAGEARGEVSLELARAFATAHPQVQEAILVSLQRLGPPPEAALVPLLTAKDAASLPPATASRALCLAEAVRRRAGEKR